MPDQVARFVPPAAPSCRSAPTASAARDTREALRRFFEIDAAHVVVAVLAALADAGEVDRAAVTETIKRHDVDPDTADPRTR